MSGTEAPAGMVLALESVRFGYRRGRAQALSGFSWSIPVGRTVLLGPNGAGKSTMMGVAAGLLHPGAGRVVLNGEAVTGRRGRAKLFRSVALMSQNPSGTKGLKVREHVAYAGWLKGMPRRSAWDAAAEALAMTDLTDLAGRPACGLSGGQTKRLALAAALIARPAVLLLDEPTAGLDPEQRARFREVLRTLPHANVLVSTHQTDDLDELFDGVAVMDAGQIRYSGSVDEFRALATDSRRPMEAAYSVARMGGSG